MIWLLAACHPDGPGGDGKTFERLAEKAGYTVQTGAFGRFELDPCCTSGSTCPMNNPDAPFLGVALPPAPDQVAVDPYPDDEGRSAVYHLRADEAVVLTGTLPPEAEYFGLRSFLYARPDEVDPVLAALGPTLNDEVVGARIDPPWSEPFALVSTLDAEVERQVTDWLVQIGWDQDRIFADRIPYPLVHTGLDETDDTFALLARVGGFANPAPGEGWVDWPGATVLRLTPGHPEVAPAEPFPLEPLPARGTGTTEDEWLPSVDALTAAVIAAYPLRPVLPAASQEVAQPTYDCIATGDCRFGNQDRYYAQLPVNKLADDGSFLALVGVNHRATGKASYEEIAVNDVASLGGVAAVAADALVGSARPYLPDDPRVDDLYVVIVARDCSEFPGVCVDIPVTCPGIDPAADMAVDFRAYLERATGAAPLGSELLAERGLLFGPSFAP